MTDIILHVGMSKTGSSALQSSLSRQPIQKIKKLDYEYMKYIAINEFGEIHEGIELSNLAECSPSGYIHSLDVRQCTTWTNELFFKLKSNLEAISDNNTNLLVMSNEGYIHLSDMFKELSFFTKLELNVKVVCYIRNPAELINSAWWQWGAWSNNKLEELLDPAIEGIANLYLELEKWSELIGKENLTIRLMPQDIVSDFSTILGIDNVKEIVHNKSLPGELLRFYQMHHELRPSEHDSSLDFILSEVLNFDKNYKKTPWVLNSENIDKIIKGTQKCNKKILDMLTPDMKEQMLSDPRWWNVDAFKNRNSSTSYCNKTCISYEELDKLLFDSIMGIKNLYMENLELKRKLLKY